MKRFHNLVYAVLGLCGFLAATNPARAQQTAADSSVLDRLTALEQQVADQKPGDSHFMVAGLTTFGFVSNKTTFTAPGAAGQIMRTNSFGDADHYELSPMLLWRHSNNLLVEFEPSFDGNTLGVNWANVTYFAAPGLQIRGGYFVVPFGIYNKRLAAGWIDKLAGDPNGFDMPGTDFGIGLSGGFPLGDMKWSYDVSLTNGLQLLPDGELQNAGIVDNNKGKMVSGRFSLLPFSNSCLEIGVSALHSNAGDAGSTFTSANVNMYGADINFVKSLDPILVNIKGQYNRIEVSRQTYPGQNDAPDYSFSNVSSAAFGQISLRPTGADDKFLKNIEIAYRYSSYNTPANSTWGANSHQNDFGVDYWLNWRTVLKCTYSLSHAVSTANADQGGTLGITDVNAIYLQFSVEF
ncbi:MAG: hypothetical protein JST32_15585 [Bacteroidetes bacterium]|nr:hypothetical protein [Bacteroidota bacterium]